MDKLKFKKYLLEEENKTFIGWDFSYLNGRWDNEDLPWDYKKIVLGNLNKDLDLLDIGTGGGEFLKELHHPYQKTSVTEAYPPNIELIKKTLLPLGITIYEEKDDELSNIKDNSFDIVIDRHESFSVNEINRILKKGGLFITQQVGAANNRDLATYIDSTHKDQFPNCTLEYTKTALLDKGFEILFSDESYPKIHFYDIGALVYFAKIIKWEFINFSVEKYFDKLVELQELLDKQGYIESTEHRFIIVCRKNK